MKTKPFEHQARIFDATKEREAYALFWEQGTGKTKPTIDTAAHLYTADKIDGMLVTAPNGVHRNWATDEIPTHLDDDVKRDVFVWTSAKANTKKFKQEFEAFLDADAPGLRILCMSYDGFMTKLGKVAARRFLEKFRVLMVLDEAHKVKTPGAKRTKSILAAAPYAPFRRILTGTPGDKPFDFYAPVKFLDPKIWKRNDLGSFYAFKQHFGEWLTGEQMRREQGYNPGYDQLLGYKNLDDLTKILAPVSDRVLKEDVLDLPEKLYTKHYFEMTPKQAALYEEVKQRLEVELATGELVDVSVALVKLLRLQEITSGYIRPDPEAAVCRIDDKNPRMAALLDRLEDCGNQQVIIWARFTQDIQQICDHLEGRAARYDGRIDDDEAARNKAGFQAGDYQYFVANPQKGAEGLTLTGATTTVFYSNSFKLIERLQAEDRNHRIGQKNNVLYVDMCAPGTVDEKIIKALRDKFDIASQMNGDRLRGWI